MICILMPLIQSPKLKEHFIKFKDYIKKEQQNRKDFYDLVTEDMNAEFINGEVVIHSPVTDEHESTFFDLASLFHIYTTINKLGRRTQEKLMLVLTRNNYEPDICFFSVSQPKKLKSGKNYIRPQILLQKLLVSRHNKCIGGVKFEG